MHLNAIVLAAVLTLDPPILRMFSEVLTHGFLGLTPVESAAFLVRDNNGDVQCVAWPQTNQFESATFHANAPEGTIAIVHTHPIMAPAPSNGDRDVARIHAIEVFAITPHDIYEADATGAVQARVKNRFWMVRSTPPLCSPTLPAVRKGHRHVCVDELDFALPCSF